MNWVIEISSFITETFMLAKTTSKIVVYAKTIKKTRCKFWFTYLYPYKWITKSFLTQKITEIASQQFNGDQISAIADRLPRNKIKDQSEKQSITAKIKANQNLAKKVWAYSYYRHQLARRKITKEQAAQEIYTLLVQYFPEYVPTGSAINAGEIPSIETIRTEWLKQETKV
jgi:hypothetical protein